MRQVGITGGRGLMIVGVLSIVACDGRGLQVQSTRATGEGATVATVNGESITDDEIERVARATGWTAKQSLRKLEDQRLLAQEAQRLGYGQDGQVVETTRRASVQALLAAEVETASPAPEEVRAFYEQRKAIYVHGERRRALHVLANLPQDASGPERSEAARRFAADVLPRFRMANDPQEVLRWAKTQTVPTGDDGQPLFRVVAESLPPVAADGTFVPEFTEALFAMEAVGDVAGPVKTKFGWHAIYLAEIVPPRDSPFEEVSKELERDLTVRRRPDVLKQYTDHLGDEYGVRLFPEGLEALGVSAP